MHKEAQHGINSVSAPLVYVLVGLCCDSAATWRLLHTKLTPSSDLPCLCSSVLRVKVNRAVPVFHTLMIHFVTPEKSEDENICLVAHVRVCVWSVSTHLCLLHIHTFSKDISPRNVFLRSYKHQIMWKVIWGSVQVSIIIRDIWAQYLCKNNRRATTS